MLQANKTEPLYQQLYQKLRHDIEEGFLPPGQRLPSERELAARHGISRPTARKALHLLTQEGYIYTRQGKGTFVRHFAANRATSNSDIASKAPQRFRRLLYQDIVNSSALPKTLPFAEEALLIRIAWLHLRDKVPVTLNTSYLPYREFEQLMHIDVMEAPLMALLRDEFGILPLNIKRSIRTTQANEEQAQHLDITPTTPVILLQCAFSDIRERIICYTHTLYTSNRWPIEI